MSQYSDRVFSQLIKHQDRRASGERSPYLERRIHPTKAEKEAMDAANKAEQESQESSQ